MNINEGSKSLTNTLKSMEILTRNKTQVRVKVGFFSHTLKEEQIKQKRNSRMASI
jgi:hypothetical protein